MLRLTVLALIALAATGVLRAQNPLDRALADLALVQQEEAEAKTETQESGLDAAIRDLGITVVTASRREEFLFDSSATTAIVDELSLARREAPSTITHALARIPGVMAQKTAPGLGSPFIRGFTGFRTAYVVDGIRLNNSVWRSGPNQYSSTIDPLSLGRLEVFKGPSSVQYGSDAIGGTVAAYTAPVDMGEAEGGTRLSGRAYYRYDSAEDSHIARTEFGVGHEGKFGFRIGATKLYFGELEVGGDGGELNNSDYDGLFIDAKARFVVNRNVEVSMLFQHARLDDIPRHHSTVDAVTFRGTTPGNNLRRNFDQDRDLLAVTLHLYEGTFFEDGWVKFGYQSQSELQDRIRANGRRDLSGFDLDTYFVATQFTSRTGIGELTYGLDLYLDQVDSFADRTNPDGSMQSFAQGPIGDDSRYLSLGLFVQDRIELGQWGELILGARFQHIDVEAGEVLDPIANTVGSLDDDFQSIVGTARLLIRATERLNFFLSAGSAFRAPNLSDLTRLNSARTNEIEIPSPGLDPEFFVGFEVGARFQEETLFAELALFHTILIDSIDRRPTGQMIDNEFVVTKDNVGDGYVQGVEFQVAWEFARDWMISGQVTYLDGEVDTFPTSMDVVEREPVSRLMPLTARVALDWRPADTGFRARAEIEFADDQSDLTTRDRNDTQRIPPNGTPGYTVYNLFLGYDFDEKRSLFLNLLNISDKEYRVHGSGSQEPGFGVRVGFDVRF
jgi:outer membrane receptor protein involved in Fe transport